MQLNIKKRQATQSIDREMDKKDVLHIYSGILLSHKKEQENAIYRNMHEPRDCLID